MLVSSSIADKLNVNIAKNKSMHHKIKQTLTYSWTHNIASQ